MKSLMVKTVACLCLFAGTVSAQVSYFHYFDYSSQWQIYMTGMGYDFNCNASALYNSHITYYVASDTLIDAKWYYKLGYVRIDSTICPSGTTVDTTINSASTILIREDASKKIYKRYGNTEQVIWDFASMSVGQSIGGCTIATVDTVWLGAMPLQRYTCSCSPYMLIIEGVGSTRGFLGESGLCTTGFESVTGLVCYSKQTNTVQVAGSEFNCGLTNLTDVLPPNAYSNSSNTITVFPNPTQNRVTVNLHNQAHNSGTVILLRNTAGQVLQSVQTEDTATTFDLTNLPSGMYFIEITNTYFKHTQKILKM